MSRPRGTATGIPRAGATGLRAGAVGPRGVARRRGPGVSAPTFGAPRDGEREPRDRRSGRQARAWLWPLVRPHRRLVALASAAVLIQTGAGLAMPYLVKVAIDQGVVPRDLAVINRVAVAYLVLAGVQFLASKFEIEAVARAGQRVLFTVRTRLFRHLQTLSLDFYERERTGRLVARMTADIDAMSDLVTDGLVTLVTGLITMVGVAVILVVLDWQLALATLVVAPLIGLAAQVWRRWSADAYRQVRETHSVVTVQLQEALSGVRAIQSFRRERATAGRLAEANQAERAAHWRTIAQASFFFPGIEFLGTAATVVVLGFGGQQVLGGDLEIGVLAAFLLYLRNLFDPVQQLSELYDSFQSATAGAERVGAVLAEEPSVREAPDPVSLPHPRGEIRLEDVCFAYDQGPEVLHHVDLLVEAGTTLALIGPTGAGKSTVAKLIARFYDPKEGRITLDGADLRQVRLADLRRAMGYVPQEGFLFSSFAHGKATVADNIRFGRPEASRAEVEAAARAIGAEPVILALPDGYDTEVGERGALLSAGERQLVAFARAWLADPTLLILDEATSNLDVATETRVTEAMRRLRQGRTTIVIAHRLSTVIEADQIAVVEDGQVVEVGPPEELLDAGGRFADLYGRWLAGAA
jgi:ATP-binding cassette, subfamily B, bacterial